WSDQYDLRLQSFGAPGLGDDVRVLEGDLGGEAVVGYHRDGRLVGVVMLGAARRQAHYRGLLLDDARVPASRSRRRVHRRRTGAGVSAGVAGSAAGRAA